MIARAVATVRHWLAAFAIGSGALAVLLRAVDAFELRRNTDRRPGVPAVARRRSRRYQVLLYHRVNDDDDPFFAGVPVSVFSRQMEILARHFAVLPLEELIESAARGNVPPRAVAITFDDGYRDNFVHAFPVLRALRLPATVFVPTAILEPGGGQELWHDRVFDGFRRTEATSVEIGGHVYPLRSVPQKRHAMSVLLNGLRRSGPAERDETIRRLRLVLNVDGTCERTYEKVSRAEICEMARGGIAFGAHTVTHSILTGLPREEAIREIVASRDTLAAVLGRPVRLFAYPNGGRGDFDDSVKVLVRESGFLAAATTLWGTNGVDTDAFELARVRAWGSDPSLSLLRLAWHRFSP